MLNKELEALVDSSASSGYNTQMFPDVEQRILKNPQSLRNIEIVGRSYGLSSSQMLQLMDEKVILDLGSGYNGLAIDAILRHINCQIFSVNPHFSDLDFEFLQKESLSACHRKVFPEFDNLDLENARVLSMKNSLALYAHNLSNFPAGKFDLIIDHYAVFGYFQDRQEYPEFLKTIHEEKRVLKPGAPSYIADFLPYGQNSLFREWKEEILKEEKIPYYVTPIPYSIIAYFNGEKANQTEPIPYEQFLRSLYKESTHLGS